MSYLLQITVGFLMVCMAFGPQSLWASFGPCAFITESRTENNIVCTNGVCTGSENVYHRQTACMDTDETPCSQNDNAPSYLSYYPQTTTHDIAQILVNAGVGGVCSLCAMGVCALTGWSGPGAIAAVEATCGVACAAAITAIDPCWFTTCERDMSRMPIVHLGGSECQ